MTKSKKKPVRHDWAKVQEEFDIYKIEGRAKTLKEFCKAKKISYGHARIRMKVTISKQKANIYDKERSETFVEAVKKKPQKQVRGKR